MNPAKRRWLENVIGPQMAANLIDGAAEMTEALEMRTRFKTRDGSTYQLIEQVKAAIRDLDPALAGRLDAAKLARAERTLARALDEVNRLRTERALADDPAGRYVLDFIALNQQPTTTPSRAKVRPGPAAPYIQDLLQGKTIHG